LVGGAAIACVVIGCGWTIYRNIIAASLYPTLGTAGYDEPLVVPAPRLASRTTEQAIGDTFAVLPELPPVIAKPETVAAISPEMFNERFSAAQPQSVASNAASAAPPVEAPKLAEAPKPAAAAKVAEAKPAETPKTKPGQVPQQVALNVPPPTPSKSGLSVRDMADRAKAAVMSITTGDRKSMVEKLWGKPASQGALLAYASADASVTGSIGRGDQNPMMGGSPPYDKDTAVYDITAHTVYLPDGTKLEAHSGLGSNLDDPRSAKIRMRGVTPPHIYELKPREALFHGVPALRLTPIGGEDSIYGRDGLLAHTFMLGANGDSNGCVSFRDYYAFLDAYRNKGIRKLAVLAKID
jgi:hypothetical protein